METKNELAVMPIKSLLAKFALPSIIALLVNSLYNIVDQIFIGNYSEYLGNAATSIPFPLFMFGMALANCISEGGAAYLSLQLGAGHKKISEKIVGNVLLLLTFVPLIISILGITFMEPMLKLFGATPEILPLSKDYTFIMILGLPFMLFGMGLNALIRADASPKYAMASMLTGAILNLILDPIFIFVFDWGIKGAAWATVIGEIASFIISFLYIFRFKFIKISFKSLKFSFRIAKKIIIYGISNFIISSAITFVIILYNNSLNFYGAQSSFGSTIPLAAYGLTAKVNQIFMAFAIGIGVSLQPIIGFNYGARNYTRVKEALKYCLITGFAVGLVFSLVVEIFPHFFVRLFGKGNNTYIEFANFSFRAIFAAPMFTAVSIVISNFFRAIGKPWMSVLSAGARFTIFLIPTIYFLPKIWGVAGVLFATPISEFLSAIFSLWLIKGQMKKLNRLIKEENKRKNII